MTNLPLLIARRYLLAKKSQNIINIISMISAAGVLVGTAALLIVLSVFNGLNAFVGSLFGSFDADLRIEPAEGKAFVADSIFVAQIRQCEGVEAASIILSDNALVKYNNRQMPAMIMGVDTCFAAVTEIDSIMFEGRFIDNENRCVVGALLAEQLGVRSSAFNPQLTLYAPKRLGKINMSMPERSFVQLNASVSGTFAVMQVDYDGTYVLTSLALARELFCYSDSDASAIEIRVDKNFSTERVRSNLMKIIDNQLVIKDRFEQHASFFKMMEVEKLMAYLILTFILAIAAFNIIGSLSMLIFEKRESIFILKSMGADRKLVTRIFLYEGWLVSIGGAVLGLILGIALVMVQQHFGIIGFGNSDAYIIEAYPVELQAIDVLLVFITVVIVGGLAAWYPVKSIVGRYYRESGK